jgi:hypothetical protein
MGSGIANNALRTPVPPLNRMQRAVVWACWLGGGLGRLIYILVIHPATQHIYSDMQGYVDRALRSAAGVPENIADTLYPPGTSMFFGVLYRIDPSWALAAIAQWLIALGVMALIWQMARRLYGNGAAVAALVLATSYFPFTHYAALFLAENVFTFLSLLSFYCLLRAGQAAGIAALRWALAAGIALALAAAFKNTIVLPAICTAVVWLVFAKKYGGHGGWPMAFGVVIGFSLLIVPLSQRCTRLNEGRFCLVSNNLAMNVLMGHYGETGEFRWHDRPRGITMYFTAVESATRGYTASADFDFGPYDSTLNLRVASDWISLHPAAALRLSLENVGTLFGRQTFWPAAVYRGVDIGAWSQKFFDALILFPALIVFARRAPAMLRRKQDSLPEWLTLAPIIGVAASVFLSIAEVRFRVPFDGLLIVAAAPLYALIYRRCLSNLTVGRKLIHE